MSKNISNYWKIAIRKKTSPTDFFADNEDFLYNVIDLKKRYWAADPFLFTYNGVDYLFYELFDNFRSRGLIAYSIIKDNEITKPKIIIKKPYHLSFPYIFEKNGGIYIVPESCAAKSILMFKAKSFPDVWVEEKVLMDDILACDSVFYETDEKKYIITSKMPKGNYCKVENFIYELSDDMQVKLDSERSIAVGDYGIRNGGKIFIYKDKIVRVGQDCSMNEYGRGILFFEIDSLDPYKEHIIFGLSKNYITKHIDASYENGIFGVHTYNSNEKYEVIDLLTKEIRPNYINIIAKVHRIYKAIIRRLRRLIKRG